MNSYVSNLNLLYDSGAWFGDTMMEKLADVTEKEAFTQPKAGVHSIGELVSHIIYWRYTLIKKLKGEKEYLGSVESPDNWVPLETLKSKGWKKLLADLDVSQKEMVQQLSKVKAGYEDQEYKPGSKMGYVTEGVIQHDIYHLGQIAIVKKMVTGR